MSKRKHTVDEILTKLREVDRLCTKDKTLVEAVKCVEISENVYYRWRKKYGWMTADEHQRMKELETENTRLKELMQLWVAVLGE